MKLSSKYFLKNTPWALATTLITGFANYAIIVIFSRFYDIETVGSYRLILSIFGILSLFALFETHKILLTAVVKDEGAVIKSLFFLRLRWALVATLIGIGVSLHYYLDGNYQMALPVLTLSLVMPVTLASTLYESANQGRKNFRQNALYNLTKFSTILSFILIASYLAMPSVYVFSIYFIVLTGWNFYFFLKVADDFKPFQKASPQHIGDSIRLSLSSVFIHVIEHIDKLLISYFLGLEMLGLYTVGISTGRMLLFAIKPGLNILSPLLVKDRPDNRLLLLLFIGGTLAGYLGSLLLEPLFLMLFASQYAEAFELSRLLLLGLGVYMVGITIYNTSVYNEGISMKVPIVNNVISPVAILIYLLLTGLYGGEATLYLFALSYPLRHLVNIIVIFAALHYLRPVQE